MPSEAGYDELRRVFDYLHHVGQVGPKIASQSIHVDRSTDSDASKVDICLVDADDLLDDPAGIIAAYCKSVGIEYHEQMLNWDSEEDRKQSKDAFEKWNGFHEDAMNSCELKPRKHVSNSPLPLIFLVVWKPAPLFSLTPSSGPALIDWPEEEKSEER